MKKTGLIALSFMMCLGLCFNVRAEGSDETPTTNTDVRVEDVQKSVEGNPETEGGNSNQGSTEIDTSKMGVEIQSTADGTTLAEGDTFAFSVKTVGEVNGQIMVKGVFSGLSEGDFDVQYYEVKDETWHALMGNSFGPNEGFPFTPGVSSEFRATAKKAGTYNITISIVDATDSSKVYAQDLMTVTVEEKTEDNMQVVINGIEDGGTYNVGETVDFNVTTVGHTSETVMVKGQSTGLSEGDFKVEYLESKDGNWYELKGNSFGPSDGFPFNGGYTSYFKATPLVEGNYTVTIQIVDPADSSKVYASDTVNFTVVDTNKPTLTTDGITDGQSFKVGNVTEFSVTTGGRTLTTVNVRGTSNVVDSDAFSVEYKEINDGKWYPFTGDFGVSTGFPFVGGITSDFRVNFLKAGNYEITISLYNVETNETLCSDTVKFTVVDESSETEDKPSDTDNTKQNSATWDDGGPFTTDANGNVYDRWGNEIWHNPVQSTTGKPVSGFQLVNTSDR